MYVRCYRLEEIVAEKMRSLLQSRDRLIEGRWTRPRSRDYYDLWRLVTDFGTELDTGETDSPFEEKVRSPRGLVSTTGGLFQRRADPGIPYQLGQEPGSFCTESSTLRRGFEFVEGDSPEVFPRDWMSRRDAERISPNLVPGSRHPPRCSVGRGAA